jgi:hypothetical protein
MISHIPATINNTVIGSIAFHSEGVRQRAELWSRYNAYVLGIANRPQSS